MTYPKNTNDRSRINPTTWFGYLKPFSAAMVGQASQSAAVILDQVGSRRFHGQEKHTELVKCSVGEQRAGPVPDYGCVP